uniref:Serine threonine-protein kinase chloroplastic-like n=1 Tax=Tetraselmis sp. GSL018 TaxID=582737 RepID=A0A061RFC8_9CHLO
MKLCEFGSSIPSNTPMPTCRSPSMNPVPAGRSLLWRPVTYSRNTGRLLNRGRLLRTSPLALPVETLADLSAALLAASEHTHHVPMLGYENVTLPCSSMNCGDMVYRSTLDPVLRMEEKGINPTGVALLGMLAYYLTARPGVLQGAVDFYIFEPLQRELSSRVYDKEDFKIVKKLAEGGFGSVYRAQLRSADGGAAKDVIVKKATEFGEAEVWMNERLTRSAPGAVAEYITAFSEASASDDQSVAGAGLLSRVIAPVKKAGAKKKEGPMPLSRVAVRGQRHPLQCDEPQGFPVQPRGAPAREGDQPGEGTHEALHHVQGDRRAGA